MTLAFIQGLSIQELIIIFGAVLLIFGPKNLPKLGRAMGQGIREFKDATNKVTESLTNMDDVEQPRTKQAPRSLPADQPEPVAANRENASPIIEQR